MNFMLREKDHYLSNENVGCFYKPHCSLPAAMRGCVTWLLRLANWAIELQLQGLEL
jgi:hypothetical protein